jgi:hypothetical protein
MLLGEMIIDRNFRLISGMGLNIGNPTIQGALLKLYRIKAAKIDDRISLRPFPRNLPKNINENNYYEQYRRDIISKSGITIFIAGTSSSKPVSEGVMQEYMLSREMGKIPIPIGVTGFAAQQIWKEMRPDIKKIYHNAVTEKSYDKLNNPSLSNEELLKTVFDIIDRVFASLQSSCLGPKQGKQTDMPICPLVVQNTTSNPAEPAMSA